MWMGKDVMTLTAILAVLRCVTVRLTALSTHRWLSQTRFKFAKLLRKIRWIIPSIASLTSLTVPQSSLGPLIWLMPVPPLTSQSWSYQSTLLSPSLPLQTAVTSPLNPVRWCLATTSWCCLHLPLQCLLAPLIGSILTRIHIAPDPPHANVCTSGTLLTQSSICISTDRDDSKLLWTSLKDWFDWGSDLKANCPTLLWEILLRGKVESQDQNWLWSRTYQLRSDRLRLQMIIVSGL